MYLHHNLTQQQIISIICLVCIVIGLISVYHRNRPKQKANKQNTEDTVLTPQTKTTKKAYTHYILPIILLIACIGISTYTWQLNKQLTEAQVELKKEKRESEYYQFQYHEEHEKVIRKEEEIDSLKAELHRTYNNLDDEIDKRRKAENQLETTIDSIYYYRSSYYPYYP